MDFIDYFFWFVAFFAVAYGVLLLVLPKKALIPTIKKQLNKKGNNDPSDEEVAKKLKTFRLMGLVCIVASAVLFYIQFTGGIFV